MRAWLFVYSHTLGLAGYQVWGYGTAVETKICSRIVRVKGNRSALVKRKISFKKTETSE